MEELKPYGVIYLIRNRINGKAYIGKTVNFKLRMRKYKKLHCKEQWKIFRALKKYGVHNFNYDIIDKASDKNNLNKLEIFYIEKFQSLGDHGYNLTAGGEDYPITKDMKKKISKSLIGKRKSEDHCKNIAKSKIGNTSWLGKHHSEETKLKLSKIHIGMKHTEESKRKMAETRTGKTLSETHKKNLSNACKGKHHTEETKRKMSLSKQGRIVSEETRKKIGDANKGRKTRLGIKHTEESKRKMSEAKKKKQ